MNPGAPSEEEWGRSVLAFVRATLEEALGLGPPPEPPGGRLEEPGACFVTLQRRGRLRGCIGSMEACRPLLEDLRRNTLAAAFSDPRFPPLSAAELAETEIEVSLLSELQTIEFESEADLVSQLRPGVDGLLLEHHLGRGTFLPAVWESLPEPARFLRELKRKAGLPEDFWSADLKVWRYTTSSWKE